MVGKSEDWLSKIERGERQAQRIDILVDLARELRVTVGDLVGEPTLAEDDQRNDNVPAIRDALMTPRRLSRILYRDNGGGSEVPPTPWAQRHVELAWRDYQDGRVGRVITALPELIAMSQRLERLARRGRAAPPIVGYHCAHAPSRRNDAFQGRRGRSWLDRR